MGGYGSGQRSGARDTTSAYRQVDVRFLQSKGALRAGTESEIWWNKDTPRSASVRLRAESNRIILDYRQRRPGHEWKDEKYAVSVEWTPCNFGGFRAWFRCPAVRCGRRVRILYGGTIFACRHCHGLAYQSQHESPGDRASSRCHAIRERLGGWGTFFDPLPPRPKGMHSRTFRRLQLQYARSRHASVMEFAGKFGMLPDEAMDLG
jgi:hypothetical protein